MKTLLLAGTTVAVLAAANLSPAMAETTKPVSQVVQWNNTSGRRSHRWSAAGNHPPHPQLCHHARRGI